MSAILKGFESLWRFILTIAGFITFLVALSVVYYIANPSDYDNLLSIAASYGLTFPAYLLFATLVIGFFSYLAFWSQARFAGRILGLTALITLVLAVFPAFNMWQMAQKENIEVSLTSHFSTMPIVKELPPQVTQNIVYGITSDGKELLLDIWPANPKAQGLRPAIVKIHGGIWGSGAKGNAPEWNHWLNDLGYTVFDVEYRMPPPPRWKDEVADIKCALGWIAENASKYGIDPTRISVFGNSAGGYLAMLAAYSEDSSALPPSCHVPQVKVKSVVNFYGPSDLKSLEKTSPSPKHMMQGFKAYIGGNAGEFPDRYGQVSPITYVSPTSSPTISFLGLRDRLVPKEQMDQLDAALKKEGVVHETYYLPGADQAFDDNWGSIAAQYARAKLKTFLEKNS